MQVLQNPAQNVSLYDAMCAGADPVFLEIVANAQAVLRHPECLNQDGSAPFEALKVQLQSLTLVQAAKLLKSLYSMKQYENPAFMASAQKIIELLVQT